MREKIVLELDKQYSVSYGPENLLQKDIYQKLKEILYTVRKQNKDRSEEQVYRVHNSILVQGKRGSGKTVFLHNLGKTESKNNRDNIFKNFHFLDVIDPTLLNETQASKTPENFCATMIAMLHQDVVKKHQHEEWSQEEYFKRIKKVSSALASQKEMKETMGLDEIYENQNALQLEKYLHEYFRFVSENILNDKIICFRIDDIDMAFSYAFSILEAIRKYLSSPYVLPIVSGDLKLYKTIVQNKFKADLKISSGNSEDKLQPELNEAKDLVARYLVKIFPVDFRLHLHSLAFILDNNDVYLKIDKDGNMDAEHKEITQKYQECLDLLFNPGIKQDIYKNTVLDFTTSNARKQNTQEQMLINSLRSWIQFQEGMIPTYNKFIEGTLTLQDYNDFQGYIAKTFSAFEKYDQEYEFAMINMEASYNQSYDVLLALQLLAHLKQNKIIPEGCDENKEKK